MGNAAPGIPILGGYFQAQAIDQETAATASALRRNAEIQDKNAEIAREAGEFNAAAQQRESIMAKGAQITDSAASGTTQDSGSALALLKQSHINAELDRLNIIHGAELQAISAENEASSLRRQAKNVKAGAEYRKYAAYAGAGARAAEMS